MGTALYHIHLVSDSTGETLSSVMRSTMSQFKQVAYEEHTWSLVRTPGQMDRAIEGILDTPGIVLYTIVDDEQQAKLLAACKQHNVPCVPVLDEVIHAMSGFLDQEAKGTVGRQYRLDDEYFARVEGINFTLAHDDGQNTEDLDDADIIIVGVSRTSKTPTCVYLSYRGLKVANIPYVAGCPLPDTLFTATNPFIVGLVISPERLIQIRKSRLLSLNESRDTSYVDMDAIKAEVQESRKLYLQKKWPVIDVTRKSVEETSATILQLYQKSKHQGEG